MSESDASTAPTPNVMPGASRTSEGESTLDSLALGGPEAGDTTDSGTELGVDEISAERDRWKRQAQTNEKRAKSNADKAKAYDADYEKFKAAYEQLQAQSQGTETTEEEVVDEAAERAADAEARAAEAEAKLLRFKLADGVPEWALGLINGDTEEEIETQVESLKENLAAYVATISEPRRPAPNPLAGRSGQLGSSPQEAFSSAFSNILR